MAYCKCPAHTGGDGASASGALATPECDGVGGALYPLFPTDFCPQKLWPFVVQGTRTSTLHSGSFVTIAATTKHMSMGNASLFSDQQSPTAILRCA